MELWKNSSRSTSCKRRQRNAAPWGIFSFAMYVALWYGKSHFRPSFQIPPRAPVLHSRRFIPQWQWCLTGRPKMPSCRWINVACCRLTTSGIWTRNCLPWIAQPLSNMPGTTRLPHRPPRAKYHQLWEWLCGGCTDSREAFCYWLGMALLFVLSSRFILSFSLLLLLSRRNLDLCRLYLGKILGSLGQPIFFFCILELFYNKASSVGAGYYYCAGLVACTIITSVFEHQGLYHSGRLKLQTINGIPQDFSCCCSIRYIFTWFRCAYKQVWEV